jgi:two-component system response regulator FlrC
MVFLPPSSDFPPDPVLLSRDDLNSTYLELRNCYKSSIRSRGQHRSLANKARDETAQLKQRLLDLAARVARTDVTVFINGPTGSGKEVLARAVHAESRRADKPFIAINCAAIPENMLEAILFGHEKGAFTGAATANRGLIRAADGGTLMLDEISEMPLGLQSKLLRVIQERQVTPLGTSTEVAVDIRIIATSNRDMPVEVLAGRFREDLYYRLNVFPLTTRPLAARSEDIPALAVSLLRRHWPQGPLPLFSPETLDFLAVQRWPGNVRGRGNKS